MHGLALVECMHSQVSQSDCLAALGDSAIFSAMDLTSRFCNITMAKGDKMSYFSWLAVPPKMSANQEKCDIFEACCGWKRCVNWLWYGPGCCFHSRIRSYDGGWHYTFQKKVKFFLGMVQSEVHTRLFYICQVTCGRTIRLILSESMVN